MGAVVPPPCAPPHRLPSLRVKTPSSSLASGLAFAVHFVWNVLLSELHMTDSVLSFRAQLKRQLSSNEHPFSNSPSGHDYIILFNFIYSIHHSEILLFGD